MSENNVIQLKNEGFDPAVIADYQARMKAAGMPFLLDEDDERSDEYVHAYFIGQHNDQDVVYDVAFYTLRMQHESELFEIAEERAERQFPNYKRAELEDADDAEETDEFQEEVGMFMAEVILELEEEERVRVKEHADIDTDTDFGIGLDVGLHVEKITDKVMETFISQFNAGKFQPDPTLYSFQSSESEDED